MLLGASTAIEVTPRSSLETSFDARSTLEDVHFGSRNPADSSPKSSTGPAATPRDVEALLGATRQLEVDLPGRRSREDERRIEDVLLGALTRSDARPNGSEAR
jgi:hypothetical protein